MAVKEMDADTLAALEEQGGIQNEPEHTDTGETVEDTPTDDAIQFTEPEHTDEGTAEDSDEVSTDADSADSSPAEPTLEDQIKSAGISVSDITSSLQTDGKVSDELIAKAKETIDATTVDLFVRSVQAEYALAKKKPTSTDALEQNNKYIYDTVGGKSNFDKISATLNKHMTGEELSLLNAKITSGNKALISEGMQSAVDKYNKLKGLGGKRMSGDAGTPPADTALPRITKEQYRTIMRSDKYKTDPAYAKKMDDARMKTKAEDRKSYGPGQYYGFTQNGRYEL